MSGSKSEVANLLCIDAHELEQPTLGTQLTFGNKLYNITHTVNHSDEGPVPKQTRSNLDILGSAHLRRVSEHMAAFQM